MRTRTLAWCGAVSLCLMLVQCGGKGSSSPRGEPEPAQGGEANGGAAGSAGMAGTMSTAGMKQTTCDPPNADRYVVGWAPPEVRPGACTAAQIQQQFDLCQDPTAPSYDRDGCRAFNAARENAACVDCLFSSVAAEVSHGFLVFPTGYDVVNVGGCIALLDGDETASGCGALTQAAGQCDYTACLASCNDPTSAAWSACLRQADSGACAKYSSAAACHALPKYAQCYWDTWPQYFSAYADLFCGSGPPSQGGESSAGAAGAAP